MHDHQEGVNGECGIESDPCETKILVDQQYDEPDPNNETFLDDEGSRPDVEEEVHDRIRFAPASIQPQHRKECIAHVEEEDSENKSDVFAGVDIDIVGAIGQSTTPGSAKGVADEPAPGSSRILPSNRPPALFSDVDLLRNVRTGVASGLHVDCSMASC